MDLGAPRPAAGRGQGAGRRGERGLARRRRAEGRTFDARASRTAPRPRSRRACEAAPATTRLHRRTLAQIGTPRAERRRRDAAAACCAGRDALATLAAHLPLRIANLADDELDECKALIEKTAARDGELFLYALLTVMSRLAAPWQVIRFGVKAAGSDIAARVAETPIRRGGDHRARRARAAGRRIAQRSARRPRRRGRRAAQDHSRLRARACAPSSTCRSTAPGAARLSAQRAQIAELLRSEIEVGARPGAPPAARAPVRGNPGQFGARSRRRGGDRGAGRLRRHLPLISPANSPSTK